MLFNTTQNNLLTIKRNGAKRISDILDIPHPPIQHSLPFNHDLQQYLNGKRLLPDEIPFSKDTIQSHYQHGYIRYGHGMKITKSGHSCQRCGNGKPSLFASYHCARCLQECTYCRNCIMMGRVSECTPLISWSGPQPEKVTLNCKLDWEGTLSKGQQLASGKVVETVQTNTSLLVWAVCGAGKTEVLFKGIETALSKGKRVCIATPRTDVVLELSPRLQQVFPDINIATLYGGSEDRSKNSPLTIATTHQLLRYYRAFDTLIIDEVDAFPYSVDPVLEYAASQARKEEGSTIYLSATPSKKMQRDAHSDRLPSVIIPARYHRKPLPIPAMEWCGNWEKRLKKNRLPGNVLYWINKYKAANRPIFLFVPNIAFLEQIVAILQKEHGDLVAGVHAKDKNRKEKVAGFREGKITILVTTTILERGVTVKNVQVGVIGAEDSLFTESALVQIAGRAGRNSQHPDGDVRFFHYGRTREMIAAVDQIRRMNYRAEKGGFLNELLFNM
ncbi:helicase [Bacillus sp. LL01]|uniref:DEAD/DEAH box helicase n=1 Tax=Bacillus sp. LL01 TaxID=1665556 RepID=UPI00064CEC6E|nr:DEAD/DEAH box helicase [Bacillus sp. LL01]KMJ59005.1 helicase [Bacillus sp. LL01]